jgi:hypothetical protein
MEMIMEDKKPDSDRIAEDAVGEALESRRSDAGKEEVRPAPTSAGPEANVAARTAESIGERAGDAYANATPDKVQERSRIAVRQGTRQAGFPQSGPASDRIPAGGQQVVTAIAAFALGYVAAFLFHGRGH